MHLVSDPAPSAVDYTLHIDPVGDALAAARACEEAVFLETYGNTSEQLAEEYGPYEAASVFVAVLDRGGDAVGTARMIMPSPTGVKTLIDVRRPPWQIDGERSARSAGIDLTRAWDVATLAVRRKQGRGGLISAALYHGLIQTLRANRAGWIVMIMDARAKRLLDMAGLRTTLLPGTKPGEYLGSASSFPLWSELVSMMDGQRSINPEAHRLISQGLGLDGVALPGPGGFTLRRNRAAPVPARVALELA